MVKRILCFGLGFFLFAGLGPAFPQVEGKKIEKGQEKKQQAEPKKGEKKLSNKGNRRQDISFPLVGEITADDVQLRSGDSINYQPFRKLRKGEKVMVQLHRGDRKEGWFSVCVPERYLGWINQVLVKEVEPGWLEITAEGRCQIRPLPTEKFASVIFIEGKGKRLHVVDRKEEWYQILVPDNIAAWVSQKYVGNFGKPLEFAEEFKKTSQESENRILAEAEKLRSERKEGTPEVPEQEKTKASSPEKDWAKEYEEAQKTLVQTGQKEDADLEGLASRFLEINKSCPDEGIREKARTRANQIFKELRKRKGGDPENLAEITKNLEDEFRELEKKRRLREKEIDERFQKKAKELGEKYTKSSKLSTTEKVEIGFIGKDWQLRSTTPFILQKGGVILMYLKSNRYDLSDYLQKEVAISGELIRPDDMDFPVMLVRKLEVISN